MKNSIQHSEMRRFRAERNFFTDELPFLRAGAACCLASWLHLTGWKHTRLAGVLSLLIGLAISGTAWGQRSFTTLPASPYLHQDAELTSNPKIVPGVSPIKHGVGTNHFDNEREIYGYNPRFMPNEVHFDQENRPWVRSGHLTPSGTTTTYAPNAASYIQTLDNNGRWVAYQIEAILNGNNAQGSNANVPLGSLAKGVYATETRIIADRDNNIYTLVNRGTSNYLLFLPHDSETWQVYPVSLGACTLEPADDYETQGVPPLLVRRYGLSVILPAFTTDAQGNLSLNLSRVENLGVDHTAGSAVEVNPQHSGAGRATVSKGDWVYLAYCSNETPSGTAEGTPQWFRAYNKVTDVLSPPLLLGYGKNPYTADPDNHNGPTIIADDTGRLIVMTGAHQDVFYTYTTNSPVAAFAPAGIDPAAGASWGAAVAINQKPSWDAGLTYSAFLHDNRNNNSWHLATRDLPKNDGTMRRMLTYFRNGSKLGELVKPSWYGYSIFYHRLTQDQKGRLFMSYYYFADGFQNVPSFYDAYVQKWPDYPSTAGLMGRDPVILMSDDGGDAWYIAQSEDLFSGMYGGTPRFLTNQATAPQGTLAIPYDGRGLRRFVTGVDAGETVTFSKVSGPAWLTVSADGKLGGIPTATGVQQWQVRVTSASGGISEATLQLVIVDADTDSDGLLNSSEVAAGTNPQLIDTDGDGFSDGYEMDHYSDPTNTNKVPQIFAVAHFDFNDTSAGTVTRDRIGCMPGTFMNGATLGADGSGRTGQSGDRALSLTAVGQRVEASDVVFLQQAAQGDDLTISFWQKLDPAASWTISSFWAVSPSSASSQRGIQANTPSGGTIYFDCAGSASGYRVSKATPAGTDWTQWNHITLVRKVSGLSKVAEIWINGVLLVSGSNMQALANDFTLLALGSGVNGSNGMKGLLDDFAVFRTALAATDIVALAQGAQPDQFSSNQAPSFANAPLVKAAATDDLAYAGSLAADASDPDATDTLRFAKISGPAWLTVAANGTLSGTPRDGDVGNNAFTVRVTDAAGLSDDAALSIIVNDANDAPVFAAGTISKPTAQLGAAYSGQTLAGQGTDADAAETLTYSKVSGPGWLSIAANGALSGTPTTGAGLNQWTVRVTDSRGAFASATLQITVQNPNDLDNDGFSNALEAAVGTDPNNAASKPSAVYNGISGWWKLDEATGTVAADATGNTAQGGTLLNSPTWAAGANGSAVVLNGTNQSVRIPALGINSNTVTMSGWIKRNGTQTSYAGIAFMRGSASGLNFRGTSHQLGYHWNAASNTYSFASNMIVPDNVWTFVGLVVEPTQATLYMQPAGGPMQTAVNVTTHNAANFNSYLYLGQDSLGSRFFKGSVDDFRIYARALNASEVQQSASATLPPPWQVQDIGSVGVPGSHSHHAGSFAITASGADIWGSSDQFRFASQALSGDGSITARLVHQDRRNGWDKAGVMIRESLMAGSKNVIMAFAPDYGAMLQHRSSTSSSTTNVGTYGGALPIWLRLTRTGNIIRAYTSTDGVAWTQRGTGITIDMAANIQIGLAVSSHDNSTAGTAVFDNVVVVP